VPHLSVTTQVLELAETFTIANASSDEERTCVVTLEHEGIVAYGEGAPVDYWGESAETMQEALEADGARLLGDDLWALDRIAARLRDWPGPQGAKMALDGAVHDWLGKRLEQPTWRLLGLDPSGPPTSFTIGIDSVEGTADRTRRAAHFDVLKVKVGGEDDLARVEAVRAETQARIRVDANEGWTLADARLLVPALHELGVEFVEQPFPAADRDAFRALRELDPRVPVYVDEGCRDLESVADVASYADGIVIKLSKCGGLREALRMVHAARALGLGVMVGCMVESQLGIAQAAVLASLVDHADLDGHLLLANEPFAGLGFAEGRVVLADEPGLGVAAA
jgi:L-alanine-DL-glutamate epimerase-like enolase superfamily enzyme